MKKVRVSLKRGAKLWSFMLYDSAESAFFLKHDPVPPEDEDDEYRRLVVLRPGDLAEIEWIGSEWVYDDEAELRKGLSTDFHLTHDKYDKIRVGKMSTVKPTSKGGEETAFLEIYSGWVHSGQIPWSDETTSDGVRITPIKGRIRSKFDFSKIFVDNGIDDSEPSSNETKEDIVLN